MHLPTPSIRPGNRVLPDEITLTTAAGSPVLRFVGPSLWGYVYREVNGSRFFRLLPIADVHTLDKRRCIAECVGRPRQAGVAPIVAAGEATLLQHQYYYVAFEVAGGTSLAHVLNDEDHELRLRRLAAVLRFLPDWWAKLGGGLVPTPSDIVFSERWPFLLALPLLGWWPRFEALVEDRERLAYVAPEIIRGNGQLVRDRNLDLYACGMAAFSALFQVNLDQSPWSLLEQAAASTLCRSDRTTQRLPFWMERADQYARTMQMLQSALNPDPRRRGTVDPLQLAAALEQLADYSDPMKLVQELRHRRAGEQALHLIEDICLRESRWDLLVAAAQISGDELGRPVEAIEFYERAIQLQPHNAELKSAQLSLLIDNMPAVFIQALKDQATDADSRLDDMVWRDFKTLSDSEQKRSANGVGSYYLLRERFSDAAGILYQHLFDGGTFMWWEVDRSLLYVKSLAGLQKYTDARSFLDTIRQALTRLRSFPPGDPRFLSDRKSVV